MLGALVRDARRQGAALLNAELEWSWPTECVDDDWVDSRLIVTSCRSRMAAARLQASLRRRQVQQHSRKPQEHNTFYLVPEHDPDGEWEVVASAHGGNGPANSGKK